MSPALTTRELHDQGYSGTDLARMVRTGAWTRARRGSYLLAPALDQTRETQHRQLIATVLPFLERDSVLSDASAAVLHGLPVPYRALDRVTVTRDVACTGRRRGDVHVHASPLPVGHTTTVDGLPVTTMARTVADLARRDAADWGLACGDAAIRGGLSVGEIRDVLATMRRWPGVRQARRLTGRWDARAESPGESLLRARFIDAGLPDPQLQFVVRDEHGRQVAICDLAWPDLGVVVEFDGDIKYGALVPPGQSPTDVLIREKRREDAIRAEGWLVVRFSWNDLWIPGHVVRTVRTAMARAHRPTTGSGTTTPR